MDALSADWRGICRRIVAEQRLIFERTPGIEERTVYEGVGEGGDRALAIDRRCEDVVFNELELLASQGASFVAVSEERGEVRFGDGGEARVVIDPIDGSLNARRTLPSHSVSIAVSSGPSMADVEFGFVHDFGAGEEFVAERGGGATLGGQPMEVGPDREMLEVLGVESAEPRWALPVLEALDGRVYRLRVVGSIAITACYVAGGRFDAMLSLRPCRSVDIAAAQLIAREAGGRVAFGRLEPGEADLGIEARYPVGVAAGDLSLGTVRGCLETVA
jgi:myo-inositol-1(or 4)-monophosphatase